jgi:carbonic anhydrase
MAQYGKNIAGAVSGPFPGARKDVAGVTRLEDILASNRRFVEERAYEPYRAEKFPQKKLVVLSCMDTRLTELLPRAMNLRNGDAKFVKNAGALVSHPFGSIMRSIVVAIYELKAEEVLVVGHYGCGMASLDPVAVTQKMLDRGIRPEVLDTLRHAGIDLDGWLRRIESIPDSVRASVAAIRHHPLIPKTVPVHGLVIDPETGRLDLVDPGYPMGPS